MPLDKVTKDSSEAIKKLKSRLSKFETEEGRLKGLNYKPKSANEIIISTTPKAGTTWLQHICHQLRSGLYSSMLTTTGVEGLQFDMEFDEISSVVPWIELAHDINQNLEDKQYGNDKNLPRMFKSHLWQPHCPVGCKYIVVLRDPFDVAVSFYRFFEGWFFEKGEVSISEFVREFWLARGVPSSKMENPSYFEHLLSWYAVKDQENVLILFFEDLKTDLERSVEKVACFISHDKCNFNCKRLIQEVTARSTFSFMKDHSSKFNESLTKIHRNEICGLPKYAGMRNGASMKIRNGQSRLGISELPEDIRRDIEKQWAQTIGSKLGYASYEELKNSFK